MKKVILKCKLTSRDKFEEKLSDIDLDFSSIYWQHDRVYVPRGYKRGINLPRLVMRTEMKAVDKPPKYSLILRRHIEDSGVDVVEETPIHTLREIPVPMDYPRTRQDLTRPEIVALREQLVDMLRKQVTE